MPSQPDSVRLLVGGQAHADWESYDVDSDLLTPADAWRVVLSIRDGVLPEAVTPGVPCRILVGEDLVMTSRIDDVEEVVVRDGLQVVISGRDRAADLVDCSAPMFGKQLVSLQEIAAALVSVFGIASPEIRAESTRLREKIVVEPGDSAWDALAHVAEANGLWPWFEPDGRLVIGGPDYDAPPVATLIMRRPAGRENNVISLRRRRSMLGRYSSLTVLGQAHGTYTESGKHRVSGGATDLGVSWYRPKIVSDHDADSQAVARDRARKLLADSRLRGFTLAAEVAGHRINAPGQSTDGRLWTPGQRVRVVSEPHGIDEVFFLMSRKFTGGRRQGPRTSLVLKEDRTWVIDAHPHKRLHRRGKNSAPGQILDASKGAAQ
jgi:prophage tail gpP-like protein